MIKEVRRIAGFLANITAVFLVATLFIDILIGARYAVDITYSMSNMTEVPEISYIPIYIFAQPLFIQIPYPITLTRLATIFISIYAALLAIAILTTRPLHRLKEVITGYTENDAIETIKIMSLTLIIIIIVEGVQERTGIPTGELESPNEFLRYISALIAPLIEEIGFRVSIIGMVALILFLLTYRGKITIKNLLTLLWRPYNGYEKARGRGFLTTLYIIMMIAAFIFGLLHFLSGGGWGIGKVTTATIAGIALGYLYIRHGFHSAVLGHSFFNVYLLSMYYIEKVGGVLSMVVEAIYTTVLVLSALYIFYIILSLSKILGKPSKQI